MSPSLFQNGGTEPVQVYGRSRGPRRPPRRARRSRGAARGPAAVHGAGDCTVLHCTVLHCTVLYCTVLYRCGGTARPPSSGTGGWPRRTSAVPSSHTRSDDGSSILHRYCAEYTISIRTGVFFLLKILVLTHIVQMSPEYGNIFVAINP